MYSSQKCITDGFCTLNLICVDMFINNEFNSGVRDVDFLLPKSRFFVASKNLSLTVGVFGFRSAFFKGLWPEAG